MMWGLDASKLTDSELEKALSLRDVLSVWICSCGWVNAEAFKHCESCGAGR